MTLGALVEPAETLAIDGDVVRCSIPMTGANDITRLFDSLSRLEAERRARSDDAPLRILYSIRAQRMPDADARRVVYQRWREFDGRFVAVVGKAGIQEFIVSFLVQATGHRNTRYFTDEARALAWLREGAASR